MLIPRIATAGTSFSPIPCQAWNGYGATNAHRVGVEVGADGHASAPPSGAAAAAPQARAFRFILYPFFCVESENTKYLFACMF
jgi:hypothetical protein